MLPSLATRNSQPVIKRFEFKLLILVSKFILLRKSWIIFSLKQSIDFWIQIRIERNVLLSESDWTQLADVVMSAKQKKAWTKYRQDLRDLPKNQSDKLTYEDIDFPPSP